MQIFNVCGRIQTESVHTHMWQGEGGGTFMATVVTPPPTVAATTTETNFCCQVSNIRLL
jgi:hypothetical protein